MIIHPSLKDFAEASFRLVTFSRSQFSTIPFYHGGFNSGGYVIVNFFHGKISFLLKIKVVK